MLDVMRMYVQNATIAPGLPYIGRRVVLMEVAGKRRRGISKRRWLENIKNDLSERELSEEEAQDRVQWRRIIRHIVPTLTVYLTESDYYPPSLSA